ncbi:MAG TPA: DUF881 domain-containing protein [Clostridia bacterium]|nr:DUF881 domain-containing protein [Clostridia bacterium]
MNKNYAKIYLPVFIIALLVGLFFNIQGNLIEKGSEDILSRQYQQALVDNEELEGQVEFYRKQLAELQKSDEESDKDLSNIDYYKLVSGFTDVKGQGIVIQLSIPDMDQPLNIVDFHRNLLFLMNELNAAGAEAIAIKDERIISTSEISVAGNHIVINGQKLSPPFMIRAIGNPDTLDAALNLRLGYVERLRNNGYFIEVKKSEELEIPKYPILPGFKYAEPLSEN